MCAIVFMLDRESNVPGFQVGTTHSMYSSSTGHANAPGKPHHRNASYTYSDYFIEYEPFVRSFRDAGMPPRRLQGGTFAGSSWNKYIPQLLQKYGDEMATYSMHKYARSTCNDGTVTQVCLTTIQFLNPRFIPETIYFGYA